MCKKIYEYTLHVRHSRIISNKLNEELSMLTDLTFGRHNIVK